MAVTDIKGNIVETYNYTPYGELIDGEYREDIPFLYNGQYGVTTDSNGLYYMRARYYNIDIKRFINQDVLLGVLERVSSLNRYAYVEGNPISYLDPFGLERVDTSFIHELLLAFSVLAVVVEVICPPIGYGFSLAVNSMNLWVDCFDLGQNFATGNFEDGFESIIFITYDIVGVLTSYNLNAIRAGEATRLLMESENGLKKISSVFTAGSFGATAIDKLRSLIEN